MAQGRINKRSPQMQAFDTQAFAGSCLRSVPLLPHAARSVACTDFDQDRTGRDLSCL